MTISNHARQRINKRCGLPKKTVERNAKKALAAGISHNESTGRLKKYFDYLYLSHGEYGCGKIRIYNDYVYLFNNSDSLITVFQLPNEYRDAINKISKRKNTDD